MKYKCKKCGTIYTPGKFVADCPKCGNSDVDVIYDHKYTNTEFAPHQE